MTSRTLHIPSLIQVPSPPPLPAPLDVAEITRRTFEETTRRVDATAVDVRAALSDYQAAQPGTDLSDEVHYALQEIAKQGGPARYDPVGEDTPYLLIKRPADERAAPLADYLKQTRLRTLLAKQVDRDALVMLPLVYSTDGKAALADTIPSSRRAPAALLARLETSGRATLFEEDFASLRGKTVAVIGHIVNGDIGQAFEVRQTDGSRAYLPMAMLTKAARKVGFNVLPLGCETGDTMPVGTVTKINDLDAIDAFRRAAATHDITPLGTLLADLSGPDLRIAIDLSRLADTEIIPIEQQDRDSKPYEGPVTTTSQTVATDEAPGGQGIYLRTSLPYVEQGTMDACGLHPVVADAISRWSWWIIKNGADVWMIAFLTAAACVMVVALVEVTFIPGLSGGDRVGLSFFIAIGGTVQTALIAFLVVAGSDPYAHGSPLLLVMATLVPFGMLAKAKEAVTDLRLALLGMKCLLVPALLPGATAALIVGAHAACLTYPLNPL